MKKPFTRISLCSYLIFLVFVVSGCNNENYDYFQGYVEGEYLHISSPIGGRLEELHVTKGRTVTKGSPLFILDRTVEAATVAEAEQNLLRSQNRLANISKGLRPSEIDAIHAKLEQAQASYNLAQIEFKRREKLFRDKVISQGALDQTRTEMERAGAAVSQLKAELETAQLGGRTDEVKAAEAEVAAAREQLTRAEWQLAQKAQNAPQDGLIFDTFYEPGEFVPPVYPVVSLLPPGNVKIRFFVPETLVSTLQTDQKVTIQFDGSQQSYQATISFISPQPEYTPPVIYSRKTRSHLVFMVEARVSPADGVHLHPGQPVDVFVESPNG